MTHTVIAKIFFYDPASALPAGTSPGYTIVIIYISQKTRYRAFSGVIARFKTEKQHVTDIKLQELAQVIATTYVYLIDGTRKSPCGQYITTRALYLSVFSEVTFLIFAYLFMPHILQLQLLSGLLSVS